MGFKWTAWVERITEKANRPMFKVSIEEAGRSLCDLLAAGGELSSCKVNKPVCPSVCILHIAQLLTSGFFYFCRFPWRISSVWCPGCRSIII